MADTLTTETAVPHRRAVRRAGAGRRFLRGVATLLPVPVLVLVAWLVAHQVFPAAVASPWGSLAALRNGVEMGWLASSGASTAGAVLGATAIASVLGVALGIAIGSNRFTAEIFQPTLGVLYALPKIIFYPFVMLLFGIGAQANMTFGAVTGLLPAVIIVMNACGTINPVYLVVSRIYGLNPIQKFVSVIVPTLLPSLVVAVRYAFSLAFLGVTMAELFTGGAGMGQQLSRSVETHDTERLYGVTLVLLVAALLGNALFMGLQRVVARVLGGRPRESGPR